VSWICIGLQSAENTTNLGVSALKSYSLFPKGYWYWLGAGAMVGFSVLFNVIFTLALAYLNRELLH